MSGFKAETIKNFVQPNEIEMLSMVFDLHFSETRESSDSSPALDMCSNPFYELFLDIMTSEVAKIVGEDIVPTYAYARRYFKGSYLEKHFDRPSCVYTITLTLNGSDKESWPIYYELDGIDFESNNYPGDATIIKGCEVSHWREKLESDYKTQLFLHYVPNQAQFNEYFYDGRDKLVFDSVNAKLGGSHKEKRALFYESSMIALKEIAEKLLVGNS